MTICVCTCVKNTSQIHFKHSQTLFVYRLSGSVWVQMGDDSVPEILLKPTRNSYNHNRRLKASSDTSVFRTHIPETIRSTFQIASQSNTQQGKLLTVSLKDKTNEVGRGGREAGGSAYTVTVLSQRGKG